MKTFEQALAFTLKWEGSYSHVPGDRGGATNKGITQAVYNSYRISKDQYTQSVKHISSVEVNDIYRIRYWFQSHCDRLPPLTATCVFDWAVNSGVVNAVKTLQAIVGTVTDGVYGAATRKAVETYVKLRGDKALAWAYNQRRRGSYLAWGKGTQAKFLKGWLNRLDDLNKTLGL